jgi:protein-tyrosine phosphatase
MPSDIYWINTPHPLRLAITARPRSGDWLEDEISHWKQSGVELVISLLERDEVDDLELGREAALCDQSDIQFISFPIPDRGLPDDLAFTMRFAKDVANAGKATVIHCRAGIGRSSVIAAAVMICEGVSADAALGLIQQARGVQVPDTEAQRAWVMRLENC